MHTTDFITQKKSIDIYWLNNKYTFCIFIVIRGNDMKDVYLLEFTLQGIKNLDKTIQLSFYKKTITKNPNTDKYHVKAIYGMNGAGKTAVITSAYILKNVLLQPNYLTDTLSRQKLAELINKYQRKIDISVQFLVRRKDYIRHYSYEITMPMDDNGEISIAHEKLSVKKAGSKKDFQPLIEVNHGILQQMKDEEHPTLKKLHEHTLNLLSSSSLLSCLLLKSIQIIDSYNDPAEEPPAEMKGLYDLGKFATSMQVYIEDNDMHDDYFRSIYIPSPILQGRNGNDIPPRSPKVIVSRSSLQPFDTVFLVRKENLNLIEQKVQNLFHFIRIFKPELQQIVIEKKEDKSFYHCSLVMQYEDYSVNAEFESTGIKKLIRLYSYINCMVNGRIVFIDEMDANLHDVYLCALLEYLIDSAQGQLCFTTHSIGPMDILKHQKKSIDFLSADHQIVSWTSNGNYSPSSLYREGMIQGSPFNVDESDFVGVFDDEEQF